MSKEENIPPAPAFAKRCTPGEANLRMKITTQKELSKLSSLNNKNVNEVKKENNINEIINDNKDESLLKLNKYILEYSNKCSVYCEKICTLNSDLRVNLTTIKNLESEIRELKDSLSHSEEMVTQYEESEKELENKVDQLNKNNIKINGNISFYRWFSFFLFFLFVSVFVMSMHYSTNYNEIKSLYHSNIYIPSRSYFLNNKNNIEL
tara:strand:- start:149 stop:769 length:621 start_codon:yes stop_codon:yes gene_type:complete